MKTPTTRKLRYPGQAGRSQSQRTVRKTNPDAR
jgi:hypothetical protein